MFPIRVCGDLLGKKANLEIPFSGVPTVPELQRRIEDVFSAEMQVVSPGYGGERFITTRMQVYDDLHQKWVDLLSGSQLRDRCQVYAFRDTAGSPVRDVQMEMPAARPPSSSYAATPSPARYTGSPQYAVAAPSTYPSPHPVGPVGGDWRVGKERPNIPFQDKIDTVFADFNTSRSGYLTHAELAQGFKNVDIDFAQVTNDELFNKADHNRDQRITPDEWRSWCGLYPNTVDCVYFRGRDKVEEDEVNRALRGLQDEAVNNESREQQLQRELDELRARNAEIARLQQDYSQRRAMFQQRRDTLERQERDLMEQEIRLERQRDHLRAQEQRFNVAASNFDSATMNTASPRRAMRTTM
eukprot:Rhum_TRINITY_DN3737_c0_g1::Rhum_TRINITY_DN3737_c0_g1_i1::g.11758::m.11758